MTAHLLLAGCELTWAAPLLTLKAPGFLVELPCLTPAALAAGLALLARYIEPAPEGPVLGPAGATLLLVAGARFRVGRSDYPPALGLAF